MKNHWMIYKNHSWLPWFSFICFFRYPSKKNTFFGQKSQNRAPSLMPWSKTRCFFRKKVFNIDFWQCGHVSRVWLWLTWPFRSCRAPKDLSQNLHLWTFLSLPIPWRLILCNRNLCLDDTYFPQISQDTGIFFLILEHPVWLLLYGVLQCSQTLGCFKIPCSTYSCLRSVTLAPNFSSHCVHLYSFFSVWSIFSGCEAPICFLIVLLVKSIPQYSHFTEIVSVATDLYFLIMDELQNLRLTFEAFNERQKGRFCLTFFDHLGFC